MKKKILLGLLAVLVIIQFIRPGRNLGTRNSEKDVTHVVSVPDSVLTLLEHSCYDCHSNRTNYPWYMEINPIGWWLNDHVGEGKAELNFSEFATYNKKKMAKKLHETAEQVEQHEMPLKSYLLMHGEAKLNDQQRKMIVAWAEGEQKKLEAQLK